MVDSGLAGGSEPVEVGAAGHAGVGSQRQRFDDVASAPNAAVADDLGTVADGFGDLRQQVEGGGSGVELATAVVRDRDRLDSGVGRDPGILHGLDALEDDGPAPLPAEPLDVLPGQARVELTRHVVGQGDRVGSVSDGTAGDVGEDDRFGPEELPGPTRMNDPVEDGRQSQLRAAA